MTESKNEFDAAKAISDLLQGIEKDRQQRILRWVAESLDIAVHTKTHTSTDSTQPGQPTGASPSSLPSTRGTATDIKTFMDGKSPKSDTHFVAAVAYYYRFEAPMEDRMESISAEVLQDATRLAGRSRFTKPIETLNNAKKQGYVDASERGAFKINSVGENLVAMTLPAGRVTVPKTSKPRKKRA